MDDDIDLDGQIRLSHLLLNDRRCRTCGELKNLIESFYRTRKERGPVPSSYSYECKDCTIERIKKTRKIKSLHSNQHIKWYYPDW